MPTNGTGILGLGAYTPERVMTNEDWAEYVDTSDEWITSRTGIKRRRFAAEGETTVDLAEAAARVAMAEAGIEATAIDEIIVATDTPEVFAPDSAAYLQDRLGARNVIAYDLAGSGCAWLLVGLAYPGNTGFAIRAAEVSGADAVFIDVALLHDGRREALRASMRADRFLPVFWEPALGVVKAARAAGLRVLAIEDVGERAPWEIDLTGRLLLVVGGEHDGIPGEVIEACDAALRIPMRGFIPAYNVQAAMAMVAGERLRQLEQRS